MKKQNGKECKDPITICSQTAHADRVGVKYIQVCSRIHHAIGSWSPNCDLHQSFYPLTQLSIIWQKC